MVEYIGYCSRILDHSKDGCTVQFDVIDNNKVYPFLNNDMDFMDSNNIDENYSHALHAYFEYGVDSAEFEQAKIAHFGDYGSLGYLNVFVEIKVDDLKSWLFDYFYIDCDFIEKETNGFFEDPYYSLDTFKNTDVKKITRFVYPQSELLSKFFQYRPIYDMQSRLTSAISHETTFYCAEMLYVGAALCVLVYTGETENNPIAIFDMGFGKIRNNSVISQATSKKAIKNRDDFLDTLLKLDSDTDVFLSHWHQDHINMALYCIGHKGEYEEFFNHATWHVPNTKSPHLNVLRKICDKKINVLYDYNTHSAIPVRVELNKRFTRGKVNCSDNQHPHHHGIFVEIELQSGKLLLLAGDCTYGGMLIDDNNPGKYDYLQICHHGGNYSLSPIEKDVDDIPNISGSSGEAYSSADGVTHGHPNKTIVQEHTDKGWKCKSTKDLKNGFLSYDIK